MALHQAAVVARLLIAMPEMEGLVVLLLEEHLLILINGQVLTLNTTLVEMEL
jgi:hypothetical protein